MAYIIYPNMEAITGDMLINSNFCRKHFNIRKSMNEIINDFAHSEIFDKNYISDDSELSDIFLNWAKEIFFYDNFTQSLINYVVDEDSFDEISLKLCNSFRAYAEKSSNYILNIYNVRVIVNLLFREIVLLDYLPEEEKNKIIGYLHVPIDKSVLMAIRLILNRKEYDHNLGIIPQNIDGGYIDSYNKYYTIQKFFNDISLNTHVPPIYYYNLIKYKEKISIKSENLSDNAIIDQIEEDQTKIYSFQEFLYSKVYGQYSENVCKILSTIFEKIDDRNLSMVILNRKKFILINDANEPEKNIFKVWINNHSIHIELEKQDIKKYSSIDEISETLIRKIENKFNDISQDESYIS